jgi:hypothetical protein
MKDGAIRSGIWWQAHCWRAKTLPEEADEDVYMARLQGKAADRALERRADDIVALCVKWLAQVLAI